MATFQHTLWGYALEYPQDWFHRSILEAGGLEAEAFAAIPEALQPGHTGPRSGQLAVRAEWNPTRAEIGSLWERKIGMLAGLMSAARVGSAPWQLRDAVGIEAEIVLPKRENTRLWTGILARGFHVLHFMVTHPKDERSWFEPVATRIIASLRFPGRVAGLETSPEGLPLPPGYQPVDPATLVDQIPSPAEWRGYAGSASTDALQAFFVREAPNFGWEILEYRPFPQNAELGFARFELGKTAGNGAGQFRVTLGVLPYGEQTILPHSPANLVIRLQPTA
jgi:hypothetical protein